MGLWYSRDTDMSLTAYSDADRAGCQDTRRSTSGSAQFLGDKLVSIMNRQETQQVAARDEKWVPSAERVKISSTNIRLETTQFWYTIKKVQDTDSYEFLLANKKCTVNAEVFKTIFDIYLRVEGVDFTNVLDDDTALTFLIDLCYKGPLNRHTNMFMDHMHQPWRTLVAIINKCLSGKTIDHRKEKRSRHKNMSYPQFTKIILNHFLKQQKSFTNLDHKHYHTIKDDGIISRVKKKVTMLVDDNITSDDPDAALELAKSISQTKAKEAEITRKVYATYARIVTEFVPESAKNKSSGRSSKSVIIQDTPSTPKLKPATSKTKLKGTGAKPGVPNEDKDINEEKVILEWGDEQDSEYSDDDNDDVEKDDQDCDIDDEGDDPVSEEKVTDAAKKEAKKTSKAKDDTKKTKLPSSSSSLSVYLGFGDQLLKLSSVSSLVSTVKDFADADPEESQVNKPGVGQEEKGNLGNINSNPHSQPDPLASIATEQIIEDDDEPQNKSLNKGEGATTEGPMDINSIIDPRLSQVVLGRPFIEVSNMTHDLPEGVVRFTNENDEVAYKMPFKIEQYNSLSNLEKEHIKLFYLRNEEDKRRGVDYIMSKILGFYKECLELGPEYVTGLDDIGEVTYKRVTSSLATRLINKERLYLMRRSLEILRKFHWMILEGRFNQLSHVSSPLSSKPGEY
uniref:Protein kinase-like domain, concanavalin A-like lectin/glucanase domain protein n=1 Tax=Tanacetum cinerariifolium TaxID=118510 RepID=A0A6L2LUN3_TANCI|nr:protein kinase-like domain, concanavalin A-like lectin/glucanase domain protein [Tanacetum cinerariifolium]